MEFRNRRAYDALPYNPKLKERARELRKAGNLAEVILWKRLKSGKVNGWDFDRQKIIGNFIVDFYCANCALVIEIDGSSHDDKQEYDAERDQYLQGLGLTVLHFKDTDVKENVEKVVEEIKGCSSIPLLGRGAAESGGVVSAYGQLLVVSQDKEKRLEYEARQKAILDHNQMMYEATERGWKEGEKHGWEQGEKRGIDRINKLHALLIAGNRLEDLKRSVSDKDFQQQLMKKYKI